MVILVNFCCARANSTPSSAASRTVRVAPPPPPSSDSERELISDVGDFAKSQTLVQLVLDSRLSTVENFATFVQYPYAMPYINIPASSQRMHRGRILVATALAACAIVVAADVKSSVRITCDNNLAINPPPGKCVIMSFFLSDGIYHFP